MESRSKDPLREIFERDKRYALDAYRFIFEALDVTLKQLGRKGGHVGGRDLLEGIRQHAVEQFGGLARMVLSQWGIHRTEDFGEMVFNLVDAGLMGKTDTDTKEDFRNGFDFSEAFPLVGEVRTKSKRRS